VAACNTGFEDCDRQAGNGCETRVDRDAKSCGVCGNACAFDHGVAACRKGVCALEGCVEGYASCDGDPANGCEVSTATDSAHCGACAVVCKVANATGRCVAGACVVGTCPKDRGDCNKDAADGCEASLSSDVSNCGACGRACRLPDASASCVDGACKVSSCSSGHADCDGLPANGCEVNLANNVAHCGACRAACDAKNGTAQCAQGACQVTFCKSGFGDCDGSFSNGCETSLLASAYNCGGCGKACVLANAVSTCAEGLCQVSGCLPGFKDCDGNPSNGCEVDLSSPANCGTCGKTCQFAHGVGVCKAGVCTLGACAGGFGDCDGDPANGCEQRLDTSQHCGACGRGCALPHATSACAGSTCAITGCDKGFADCNQSHADGCEADLSRDGKNCGTCGLSCSPANGVGLCQAGKCLLAGCVPGFEDCDQLPQNGCETSISSESANCGGCGNVCALSNAVASCEAGRCKVSLCRSGFGDCDGAAPNGCEAKLLTSQAHCGGCGKACKLSNAAAACSAGVCQVVSCLAGFADCDALQANGCEADLSLAENCGGCGKACQIARGTAACVDGACAIAACDPPYADCNGTVTDGCEIRLDSVKHCGACGRACQLPNATPMCTNGNCEVLSCAGNFGNCDKSPGNGCETNLSLDRNHCGTCGNKCPTNVANVGCSSSTCVCPGTMAVCAGSCVDRSTNASHCGTCGNACAADESCIDQACVADREWAQWPVRATTTYALTDDTVVDNTTGLMWQRKVDDKTRRYFEDAVNFCNSLVVAGFNDWRLPTYAELSSIVDHSRINPAMNVTAFGGSPNDRFWTSTLYAYDRSQAWEIRFNTGEQQPANATAQYDNVAFFVRCVR
jgi:hypothetical protein